MRSSAGPWDITTNEKSWNVWTDDGWSISLGRMLVDGEKMRTEAPTLGIQTKPHSKMDYDQWRTGRKYFKDYFSVIFMYHEGTKKIYFWREEGTLQLIKKIFCYFEVCPMWGRNVHSFLWTTTLYVVVICCCLFVMFFSTLRTTGPVALCFLLRGRDRKWRH